MSFFKKLFSLVANTSSSKLTSRDLLNGNPLEGQENEIHVKRVEKYTEGDTIIHFHFPDYERDLFSIKLIEDEFTKDKIIKPYNVENYRDRVGKKIMIGLLSDKEANYITFSSTELEMPFNINDKLSILFDDEEIWDFPISEKGYSNFKLAHRLNEYKIDETKTKITQKQLEKMSKIKMTKWKYSNEKDGKTYMHYIGSWDSELILVMSKMQLLGVMDFINKKE